MFTNLPSSVTLCPLLKTTCPNWTIHSWQGFNSLVCSLMLKTNYRCVEWINISVDVAKCVVNVHKFNQVHSLFVRYKKTTCPDRKIYSWKAFYSIGYPLMLWTNYWCVQSLNISVDVAKCLENVHDIQFSYTHFLSVTKNDLSSLINLSSNSFGDVYTDVELLNTSVVCFLHKRTY